MRLDLAALCGSLGGEALALDRRWLARFEGGGTVEGQRLAPQTERALARRAGAVAVLPVNGIITAKPSVWEEFGLAVSAATVGSRLQAAVDDPEVKAIVLDIDSPGGGVAGVEELAAEIRTMREQKPIIAHANYLAASAAYWLASSATQIDAAPSAMVGSVGVYVMHVDYSSALDQAGIKLTFISAGEHKVEGNPYEPLGDDARETLQAMVDGVYGVFVRDVAAGRGVTASAVQEGYGQGRVLSAREALVAGMIDRVRPLSETLAALGVGQAAAVPERRRALSTAMAARRLRVATI